MADQLVSTSELFNSKYNIPYSTRSSLNSVDLHFPSAPASASSCWLMYILLLFSHSKRFDNRDHRTWCRPTDTFTLLRYIHGGAFRDPLQDSTTILPSLPHLFDPSSSHYIYGVASINYRLSPYPSHPTDPSSPDDSARKAKWPDYLADIQSGIQWVLENGESHDPQLVEKGRKSEDRDYILAGHSVGGTMTLKVAQSEVLPFRHPVAALSLCGIYDFFALRDAHLPHRQIYDDFTTAAFGPEEDGGWERGNTKTRVSKKVEVVVLAHSKTDTLVDWEQIEVMRDSLMAMGPRAKGAVMELNGDHKEIYEKGEEVARAVKETLGYLGGLHE